ncbi:hypothetical protein FUAX_51500 (plasmid) [Fulvitalea axinellae]|uniref:Uncharacterized protein n=1 Tax=Fulvitalea axinellae TaxID=1182444 RepID=A0AAU9CRD7_9BACT|nr:hypothetical protein FUAX_51500 [Fulvitalea axinellae]
MGAAKEPPAPFTPSLSKHDFLLKVREIDYESEEKKAIAYPQDILDIASALEHYHGLVASSGPLLKDKDAQDSEVFRSIRERWNALEMIDQAIFRWNANHLIPARRLSFFRHLSVMEDLLREVNETRVGIVKLMERLKIPPYPNAIRTDYNARRFNELWKAQLDGRFLKCDWSGPIGERRRFDLNAHVLRLILSDTTNSLVSEVAGQLDINEKPAIYLYDDPNGLPFVQLPALLIRTEGVKRTRITKSPLVPGLLEGRMYVPSGCEQGTAGHRGDKLLSFYPPILHLANVLEGSKATNIGRKGYRPEIENQLRTELKLPPMASWEYHVRTPDEYALVDEFDGLVVDSLEELSLQQGKRKPENATVAPPQPTPNRMGRGRFDRNWRSELISRVKPRLTPETSEPKPINEKLSGLLEKVRDYKAIGDGTQASVFRLSMSRWGDKNGLILKVLREGSFSSVAEKEDFAAKFLLEMKSPRVLSQASHLISRASPEFQQLLSFADSHRDKALSLSLRTFLASGMEHVIIFREAVGMPLALVQGELASELDLGKSGKFFRALGELAFYDVILGNSDRVLRGIHPSNVFIDHDRPFHLAISAVDHTLDFSWMYAYVRDLNKRSKDGDNVLSSFDLRLLILSPWQDFKKVEKVVADTKTDCSKLLEDMILKWRPQSGFLPVASLFAKFQNAEGAQYPIKVYAQQLHWFEDGFTRGAVNLYEKRELIENLKKQNYPRFQIDATVFFHQCDKVIELVEQRYAELKATLPSW